MTTWNGKRAAVSLTFDDGLDCQLKYAIPEMDKRGIKGTFFLPTACPAYPITWAEWTPVAENGHEIGSHSVTHSKAASLTMSEAHIEAKVSKAAIRAALNVACSSFCYPYTDAPSHLRLHVAKHYFQARGGRAARLEKNIVPGDGVDMLNIPAYHISEGTFRDGDMTLWLADAMDRRAWITLMFHGVGPDAKQWDNVPAPLFGVLLDLLKSMDVWVAPFGTVADAYRSMGK